MLRWAGTGERSTNPDCEGRQVSQQSRQVAQQGRYVAQQSRQVPQQYRTRQETMEQIHSLLHDGGRC